MSAALIIAAIIAGGTVLISAVLLFGSGMSDATDAGDGGAVTTFIVGLIIAGLVAASHWLPHIAW